MNKRLKQTLISFAISGFAGLIVNLIIDIILSAYGREVLFGMSPEYVRLFPTPVIAAYVNILLYGIIGAVFAGMSFIYEIPRLGFILQSIIYFLVTSIAAVSIMILLWQLQNHPQALVSTITGYGMTYIIIGILEYRRLKEDIRAINEACSL